MADLWRVEGSLSLPVWFTTPKDLETIRSYHALGQGVLLITPHLGNWEVGGSLLAQHGVKLLVITQPEPGRGLTELRRYHGRNGGSKP